MTQRQIAGPAKKVVLICLDGIQPNCFCAQSAQRAGQSAHNKQVMQCNSQRMVTLKSGEVVLACAVLVRRPLWLSCGGDVVGVLLLCVGGMGGSSRRLQVARSAPL